MYPQDTYIPLGKYFLPHTYLNLDCLQSEKSIRVGHRMQFEIYENNMSEKNIGQLLIRLFVDETKGGF